MITSFNKYIRKWIVNLSLDSSDYEEIEVKNGIYSTSKTRGD